MSANSILFADRPVRAPGRNYRKSAGEWSPTNQSADSFTKDPPNATVSAFSKDGSAIHERSALNTVKLDGDRLTFDVVCSRATWLAPMDRRRFSSTGSPPAVSTRVVFTPAVSLAYVAVTSVSAASADTTPVTWDFGYAGVHPAYRGAWYRLGGWERQLSASQRSVTAAAAAAPYYAASPIRRVLRICTPNPPC